MMVCCCFFLFVSIKIIAQPITLSGAIVIGKAEVMSYQIVYEIDKSNSISGYSLCDVNGKQETKASITGTYYPKSRRLVFEEKSIINTRLTTLENEFCLMQVEGRLSKKEGKNIFNGKFNSGSHSEEIVCDSGSLILLSTKALDMLAKKVTKATVRSPGTKDPEKDNKSNPIPVTRNVVELTSGMVKEIELKSDKIFLDIVDDRFQDGDRIRLLKNDAIIANSLEITNDLKTFDFSIGKAEKETAFTIIAENEGSIALTTIKAALRNGDQVDLLIISLNKGESVKFVLKRK